MVAPEGSGHPVRTCVGCRSRAAKADLVRLVLDNGRVTPDTRGGMPGRGAHLHRDHRCLELAQRRRAWSRAFRTAAPGGADGWDDSLVAALVGSAPRDSRGHGSG
ncbi:YlxR family protein [Nocardiopsis sp. HNM0947]|uniref:YlxR family protein n=1 Tax=Nocardiopsis coralli TaxID=2772213 RepID=A0ABR9PE14_9ACTN|nr:YlxR family protein [Nocardiopsis coralli]MBE3002085.1 YlxR family protein [Nocardiopsis coralli]